jgi:acyl-CoA synthetase (AMP-forming)/AMP-acid ligase II
MLKPAASELLSMNTRHQVETLLDLARRHCEGRPEAASLVFYPASGDPYHVITVREFFDGAARYCHALRGAQVGPRDLVILVMEHSEALMYAFWGAMMMGAIPSIFPFLSDKLDPDMYFERVRLLLTHSGAKAVIASEQFAGPLAALLKDTNVRVVTESSLEVGQSQPTFDPGVGGQDVAFLQHSSGTTGLQKGVALSHGSVLNQIASYSAAIRLTAEDRIASWLPLYHDMGLIAGFIMPIAQGIPLIIMSRSTGYAIPKSCSGRSTSTARRRCVGCRTRLELPGDEDPRCRARWAGSFQCAGLRQLLRANAG